MKLAQYVADWIASFSPRVYAVCGAGAMHLNDAICHHDWIDVIAVHHEQAACFAAEAEARITNEPSVVHVTAGPGGTNTMTGIACAFVDSIPMIVLAGQVSSETMRAGLRYRQYGMNELDMLTMVKSITKYCASVTRPDSIRYHLERALHLANTGRKGPVWLEIPLDIQAAEIDPASLRAFNVAEYPVIENQAYLARNAVKVMDMIAAAKRPLMIIGNGVRLSGACDDLLRLVNLLEIPVVSSWNASDIVPNDYSWYIGRCGIFGGRVANRAVQDADVILAIGTRLSVAQIGHDTTAFAPHAAKIVVDIDPFEAERLNPHLAVVADAGEFIRALFDRIGPWRGRFQSTVSWVRPWASGTLEDRPALLDPDAGVDAYRFVRMLPRFLDDNAIVVTDVGFSFIPVMQELSLRPGQRLFHSSGVSPMGWALAAAIGAAKAAPDCQVVCLIGDGGLMVNIQEFHTIAQLGLRITVFVFCNDGYATMRLTQQHHFQRESISGPNSGRAIAPEMIIDVAERFNLPTYFLESDDELDEFTDGLFNPRRLTPCVVALSMAPDQVISPRVMSYMKDGQMIPGRLDAMWPPLAQQERIMETAT